MSKTQKWGNTCRMYVISKKSTSKIVFHSFYWKQLLKFLKPCLFFCFYVCNLTSKCKISLAVITLTTFVSEIRSKQLKFLLKKKHLKLHHVK